MTGIYIIIIYWWYVFIDNECISIWDIL